MASNLLLVVGLARLQVRIAFLESSEMSVNHRGSNQSNISNSPPAKQRRIEFIGSSSELQVKVPDIFCLDLFSHSSGRPGRFRSQRDRRATALITVHYGPQPKLDRRERLPPRMKPISVLLRANGVLNPEDFESSVPIFMLLALSST